MADYRLPSLGADMDQATFVEWLVQPGDSVAKGQVVATIETAKALMEIEFFEDGVIEELLAGPGEVVAVGAPIARFRSAKEAAPTTAAEEPTAAAEPTAPVVPAGPEEPHAQEDVRRLAERLKVDLGSMIGTGHGGRIRAADVLAAAGRAGGEAQPSGQVAPPGADEQPRRISPRARRMAEEHGIDLSQVRPSGARGEITGADIERRLEAAAEQAPAAAPEERRAALEPARTEPGETPPGDAPERARARRLAMRKAIADLMARSKREIPHYYLSQQIDMSRALDWLETENLSRPVTERLLPAVLLIKAVAQAIGDVPEMNGFWIDDKFVPGEGVHPGIAISLREGGLVAPAIHDADQLSLDELMPVLRDLVTRTRAGALKRPEMADPTITITNLGDQGVDAVHGVIYPPQVALVGFGRVVERPWAERGMVGPRRMLTATLAADHRNSDGHRGGIFLASIDRRLQEPEAL
jgi:pyruvate dehydrogenase E2 component (dihydrolipoamide acetyltransferase)